MRHSQRTLVRVDLESSYERKLNTTVIVFNLRCDREHRFEGWFDSSDDFARQLDQKLLTCPLCGSASVVRLPAAPHVRKGGADRGSTKGVPDDASRHYVNLAAETMTKLIDQIVENTEDVGAAFPEEARKIHYHEVPERRIRGTASNKDVEALRDEGIDVVALPIPAHRLVKAH